jgi:hypothetical protein
MADLSGIIKNTGVALEAEAFKQFGAAVTNQVNGILGGGTPKNGPFVGPDNGTSPLAAQAAIGLNTNPGVWDASYYAAALADANNYDPKTKFLFKVKFEFYPELAQKASSLGVDLNDISRDLTFSIKQIDLPKVDFEYEEVNMYNFRTKVLRQIKNRELTMTFYDNTGNHALAFVNVYMMLFKPISRVERMPSMHHEDHGFAFNQNYTGLDTAYRGYLPGNRKDILSKMTVEQFYLDRAQRNPAESIKLNRYIFTNPRITAYDIDDQDHEAGGEANTITATFDFDALNITMNIAGAEHVTPTMAPGKSGARDILSSIDDLAPDLKRGTNPQGHTNNPFIDILARQGQRAVQDTVSNVLNKNLGTVAGGALAPAISTVAGALGAAANNTIGQKASSAANSLSIPKPTPVKDNSAPSGQVADLSRQTASNDLMDWYG